MKTCPNIRVGLAIAGILLFSLAGCAGKPAPAPAAPSSTSNPDPAEIRGGGGDPNARRDSMGKMVQERMGQNKQDGTDETKDSTPPDENSDKKPEEKPEEK